MVRPNRKNQGLLDFLMFPSAANEFSSPKMLNIQMMSVLLWTGWPTQICTYIAYSQTTPMPRSRNTTVNQDHPVFYYTIIMVLQPSSGGDTGKKCSRSTPAFLVYQCTYQPQWDHQRLGMKGFIPSRSSMTLELVIDPIPETPRPELWLKWRIRKAKHTGKKMTWCCFLGGTRTLPNIAIGRRWRKILSVWSSGGKMCLRI